MNARTIFEPASHRPEPRWLNPGRAEEVQIVGRAGGMPVISTVRAVFYDATQTFSIPEGARLVRLAQRRNGELVQTRFGELFYVMPEHRAVA